MSINQTFNSYKHRMRLDEMYYTEIEMEGMKEILRDKEEYIKKLEEENIKLKLHIEAKDKAYTALLKDYEEIKEDRDKMKKRVKEHIIYSIKAEFIKKFGE